MFKTFENKEPTTQDGYLGNIAKKAVQTGKSLIFALSLLAATPGLAQDNSKRPNVLATQTEDVSELLTLENKGRDYAAQLIEELLQKDQNVTIETLRRLGINGFQQVIIHLPNDEKYEIELKTTSLDLKDGAEKLLQLGNVKLEIIEVDTDSKVVHTYVSHREETLPKEIINTIDTQEKTKNETNLIMYNPDNIQFDDQRLRGDEFFLNLSDEEIQSIVTKIKNSPHQKIEGTYSLENTDVVITYSMIINHTNNIKIEYKNQRGETMLLETINPETGTGSSTLRSSHQKELTKRTLAEQIAFMETIKKSLHRIHLNSDLSNIWDDNSSIIFGNEYKIKEPTK